MGSKEDSVDAQCLCKYRVSESFFPVDYLHKRKYYKIKKECEKTFSLRARAVLIDMCVGSKTYRTNPQANLRGVTLLLRQP